MLLKNLETFIQIAKEKPKKKLVVVAGEDDSVLSAVAEANLRGIVEPILVGNTKKIEQLCQELNISADSFKIVEEPNPTASARKAVQIIKSGEAQVLMKGLVGTADFLRAILDKDTGLRKGELLSHIGFFEVPAYHKLLAVTDAAQNIAPTLDEKVSIIKNSIDLFHRLGIKNPKVGIACAVEMVNPKMEATIHAGLITMMNKRGQIKGCTIDGPLAFDNIVSKESCRHKGITSEVGGDADLILTPDIEAGNILYKCLTYFAKATVAAIILGATVPAVLTSRADTEKSKLMSIALAASF
jgi:phosphate butyryltransferase